MEIRPNLQHQGRGHVLADQAFYTANMDMLPMSQPLRVGPQYGEGRLHLPLCSIIGVQYGVFIVSCEDHELADRLSAIQNRLRRQCWWPKNPAQVAVGVAKAAAARGGGGTTACG